MIAISHLTVEPVRSGRSLDITPIAHNGDRLPTYRLRLEAGHGDEWVPETIRLIMSAIEEVHP